MEDALVRRRIAFNIWLNTVLILVLMEDALVHNMAQLINIIQDGLNPCFNGRCTRTLLCS